MFVALVLYTSANGFENKIWAPARSTTKVIDGVSYPVRRVTAFPTLEEAQAALSEDTNPENPFTSSILKNGYRALIIDLTPEAENPVVSDVTVAAIPQTESASVQAN